ncbi:hypothetical protein TRVL_01780 [Trypanosoma vivax]|uniref:Uncharacterized protein n=1 Tax=Trypanosoma vivax (strain Y486) TaxID=1055687 RepID=G0U7Z4_TRYVY|nr:hypothetical protein TRVL_01780 [Trypanosoma vivax]CCC52002.1 hypothetical protein, unlikely [Trypanosoma vivax Y486]
MTIASDEESAHSRNQSPGRRKGEPKAIVGPPTNHKRLREHTRHSPKCTWNVSTQVRSLNFRVIQTRLPGKRCGRAIDNRKAVHATPRLPWGIHITPVGVHCCPLGVFKRFHQKVTQLQTPRTPSQVHDPSC